MGDTIFALSSGRPPAAIAIIRISGPQAHESATALTGPLPEPRQAVLRQLRHPENEERLDDALVLRFDAQHSATGEDLVELHCHGGRAVVDAVLGALAGIAGLRMAESGEFTRRAFEHGRIDLTEAEGLGDLLQAETESQRRAALAVAEGGLRHQVEQWQQALLGLSARAERAIDYVDEEPDDGDSTLSRECGALALELQSWLDKPRVEPLKDGVRVVIAGPPNAGKSSLINALVGEDRAIVTEVPGTTRDHIDVPIAIDGIPVLLTDTAGLRESRDQVEAIGVARAARLVDGADILLWMGEPHQAPKHPRMMLIHGKADLSDRADAPPESLSCSSATGEGLRELLQQLGQAAKEMLPADDAIALNRRQATLIEQVARSLVNAQRHPDLVVAAEEIRAARLAFDRLTGRAGVEEVLDALFARFCLGK